MITENKAGGEMAGRRLDGWDWDPGGRVVVSENKARVWPSEWVEDKTTGGKICKKLRGQQ